MNDDTARARKEAYKAIRKYTGPGGLDTFFYRLLDLADLYTKKNRQYRSGTNPLANFHNASPVLEGYLTPPQYALVLCAKQDDALNKLVACLRTDSARMQEFKDRGGIDMLIERAYDGAVFRLLIVELAIQLIHTNWLPEQIIQGLEEGEDG